MDAIKEQAVEFAKGYNDGDTFKIDVKRSDKQFPYDTYEIQREVGIMSYHQCQQASRPPPE